MNKLFKKVMLAVVVLPLTFSSVYAKPGGHRGDMNAVPLVKMLRQVDLTAKQQVEVKSIIQNYRTAEKGTLHDEMLAIIKADKFDAKKAEALIVARDALKDENKVKRLQMRHDVYQALTEEQQAKMDLLLEMEQQKGKNRRKGGGKGHRQGGGQGNGWGMDSQATLN